MLRIRQQYWFCLAGLCLVGSLAILWTGEIEVADQPGEGSTSKTQETIYRRLGDLPVRSAPWSEELAQIPLDRMPFETERMRRSVPRAPAAVPSRRATPLNSTIPTLSRDQVTPAGFQNHSPSGIPDAVWLSGEIEDSDSALSSVLDLKHSMYEAHWKLVRRPFDEGLLPDFYFASQNHQAALLKLRYLIDQRKGIGVIAGEHGLGKTYLTHVLEHEARHEGIPPFVRLVFPQLSPAGTLAYFAGRLGSSVTAADGDDVILRDLEHRLAEFQRQQQHLVLMIDDAHLLDLPQLQVLRLMLNLRENGRSDFSLILSGRTELLARLQRLAALDQRVVVRAALEPLVPDEVLSYLHRRLQVAGRSEQVFDDQAARTIWDLTQGIPRRINQLCDLALLVGYVDDRHTIQSVEVEAAAEELMSVAA